MKPDKITRIMSELGNSTRLDIFRLLVRDGGEGLVVGEIGRRLNIPPSTLGFHLKGLVDVGLVSQKKSGRSILCQPQLDVLLNALRDIERECCADTIQRENL
ncbi:MAG: helix-turn-helix domain-containing protein [Sedimenticola sp.]